MSLFSGYKRTRPHSLNLSQNSSPPSYTSTPSSPPSYRSHPYETASVRTWPETQQQRPWHSSISLWSPAAASVEALSMFDSNLMVESPSSDQPPASGTLAPSAAGQNPALYPKVYGTHAASSPPRSYPTTFFFGTVYYSVFTATGAVRCRRPVDRQNPYLGRIDAMLIPPPHTVGSIISCMCKIERAPRYGFAQLFQSASSASPLDRGERVALLNGSGPGSDPRNPLALLLPERDRTHHKLRKTMAAHKAINGRESRNALKFR